MTEKPTAFDSVLSLCQDQHRRIVLGALVEEQRSLTLDELTNAILTYNHGTPPAEASEDAVTDIHISLYHVHLPRLASKGFIDYDREQGVVDSTEQLEQVQPTLSTLLAADPSLKPPMKL